MNLLLKYHTTLSYTIWEGLSINKTINFWQLAVAILGKTHAIYNKRDKKQKILTNLVYRHYDVDRQLVKNAKLSVTPVDSGK